MYPLDIAVCLDAQFLMDHFGNNIELVWGRLSQTWSGYQSQDDNCRLRGLHGHSYHHLLQFFFMIVEASCPASISFPPRITTTNCVSIWTSLLFLRSFVMSQDWRPPLALTASPSMGAGRDPRNLGLNMWRLNKQGFHVVKKKKGGGGLFNSWHHQFSIQVNHFKTISALNLYISMKIRHQEFVVIDLIKFFSCVVLLPVLPRLINHALLGSYIVRQKIAMILCFMPKFCHKFKNLILWIKLTLYIFMNTKFLHFNLILDGNSQLLLLITW